MWDQAAAAIKPKMTENEFSLLLYPIFQKLGCGHSRVYQSENFIKAKTKKYKKGGVRKQLPFSIKSFQGKTYINSYFHKDSLLFKGDQLLKVNDIPIDDLKVSISNFISSDGLNKSHYKKSIDKNFIAYYHRGKGYQEKYNVEIIDSLGAQKTISLPPYLVSKALSKQRKKDKRKKPVTPKSNDKPAKYTTLLKKSKYRFLRSVKDTSVVVIKIPSFAGKDGKKIYKKAYRIINEDPTIKNLVIDLRGNGGGSASESWFLTRTLINKPFQTNLYRRKNLNKSLVKELSTNKLALFFSRLKILSIGKTDKTSEYFRTNATFEPHKKHRYDGKLFILTDGYSFSASSVVASYLKTQNRGIFIGEETGGGMYGTNAMHSPYIVLPNTTIRIRIGLWALDQIVEGGSQGRGIFPDYQTAATIEDFINEKDVDMEKVYELIKIKK